MTRSFAVFVGLGICTLGVGVVACGDGSGGEQVDAAAPQDAAQEDGPNGTVRVYVVSGLSVANWTGVAGADVVIDKPGGGREEKQTGSDGRVTFTGLDFSIGKAAVTAYKAGSGLPPTSQVGITADSGEVLLYLWAIDYSPTTVAVSGTALNQHAASDRLWVTSTNSWNGSEGVGAAWSMEALPGMSFSVFAVDYTAVGAGARGFTRTWYSWVAVDHEAVNGATTMDIDLANPPSMKQATGTLVLPARAESVLRTKSIGQVWALAWSLTGSGAVGGTSSSRVSTDGTRIEYTVDWIEPTGVEQPVTQYALSHGNRVSLVIRAGYPPGGELDATFIDLPELTNLPDHSVGQTFHDEIAWQVFDPDVWMRCMVSRGIDVSWVALVPPTETSLRVPQGPSSLDEAVLLGDEELTGECDAIEVNLASDWVERVATSSTFPLGR